MHSNTSHNLNQYSLRCQTQYVPLIDLKTIFIYIFLYVPVNEVKNGKELTISAEYITSGREQYLVKHEHSKACRLCSSEIDLKHTDVLILSQYLRSDGCMLPKTVTGLCSRQQVRVRLLVAMAQKAGLMPNINPANSNKDPHKRFGYKRYNKYFDEDTLPRKYY